MRNVLGLENGIVSKRRIVRKSEMEKGLAYARPF